MSPREIYWHMMAVVALVLLIAGKPSFAVGICLGGLISMFLQWIKDQNKKKGDKRDDLY